jgi:hypothetical protein
MTAMDERKQYREYADQCLRLSKKQIDLKTKVMLLRMAGAWLKFAEPPESPSSIEEGSRH